MMGLLAICEFGPFALFGLFGGLVVDAHDRRMVLLCTHSILMACATILAVSTFTGAVNIPIIFTVAAIRSFVSCVSFTARRAFLIELVGKKNVSNAMGLGAAGENLARTIGPASAGVIISIMGVGACFAANAASFLGMIWVVYQSRERSPLPSDLTVEKLAPLSRSLAGLRYILGSPRLFRFAAALFLITFIPMSFGTTLPIFASNTLGRDAAIYGMLVSCLSLGSIGGSLFVASREQLSPRWIFVCVGGLGVAELLLVLERSPLHAGATLLLAGFCMTSFIVSINSIVFSETKDGLHGRVGAVTSYIIFAVGPLGSSISGWLSGIGGTDLAFEVGGCMAIAVAAAGIVGSRKLAQLRDT